MTRECYLFKKDGNCKFGEKCRYRHTKKTGSAETHQKSGKKCDMFTSKEGCKGSCQLAHLFPEDLELLDLYTNGIDIINVRVRELPRLKEQCLLPTQQDINYLIHKPYDQQDDSPCLTSVAMASSWEAASSDQYRTEIRQVERLYRGKCHTSTNESGTLLKIIMKPTDPEWNLTLMQVSLEIFIPVGYPAAANCCTIQLTDKRVSQSTMDIINNAIAEELSARHSTMCVRPMLRWVDRNLLQFLQRETQFHTPLSLRVYKKGEIEWTDSSSEEEEEDLQSSYNGRTSDEFLDKELGTSIRLVELDLHGTSHGLMPHQILLLVQCLRCKTQAEMTVGPGQEKKIDCVRCGSHLSCLLHKKLCLPSSACLCCVEMAGATLADALLPRSQVSSICFDCSDSTNLTLTPGTRNSSWCGSCGKKITISFLCTKIVVINPPCAAPGKNRLKKQPREFVQGQPLPERGTCKHYKKSLRWFRFKCCQRLFPCDRCHDEQLPDCPLEMAGRMVCGHCAYEQPISMQCKYCHGEVGASARSSHWEGGKGCRNQLRMSNNDSRKHKNSKLKTHSQKEKRVGQKKRKEEDK